MHVPPNMPTLTNMTVPANIPVFANMTVPTNIPVFDNMPVFTNHMPAVSKNTRVTEREGFN